MRITVARPIRTWFSSVLNQRYSTMAQATPPRTLASLVVIAAEPPGWKYMGRNPVKQRRNLRPAFVSDQHHAMTARLQFGGKRVSRNHVPAGTPSG